MPDYSPLLDAPSLHPAEPVAPAAPLPPRGEPLPSSLLKKPLDNSVRGTPPSPAGYPPRFK